MYLVREMGLCHLLDTGILHLQLMQRNPQASPPPGAGEGQAEGISLGFPFGSLYETASGSFIVCAYVARKLVIFLINTLLIVITLKLMILLIQIFTFTAFFSIDVLMA
jgi:hypothetical protein